ncbi:restriction endonuclease subunit S [Brachyspira pilosicoli]|uniref:restriction endonuclease subunit S n=1 Tax=Brachyspira pilosicoli TaxID=52584 RepID=UPI00255C8711|nr:restriction endonuclease subunit S [Brachyspira pilosicoli]
MSKLEEFLKKHCPDGVECKALSELGIFYAGLNGKNKDDFKDGNAKYITYINVFSNLSVNININDTVQIGEKEKQNIVKYGDVIFTGSSETIEECGMSSVVTNELNEKLYLNSFCFGFRFNEPEIMLPDFSKYLFRSTELRKKIIKTASGVTRFNVSKKKMEKILIPIPPIEVQKEIVRILDEFTEKTTKLQELLHRETVLRKKQYEYYRDKLLTFNDNVEWKILNEVIISLNTGLNPRQFFRLNTDDAKNYYVTIRELQNNTIKFSEKTDKINDEALKLCNKRSNLEVGDVLFSGTGTIGETAIIDKFPSNWNIKEGIYSIKPNKSFLVPKFLMYLLKSSYIRDIYLAKADGGTVKSVPMKEMRNLKIPIPPLEEQERIVNILDKFDALCNDITRGLPAEIEMRKKQYEYYRDKLLTFKEKNK